MTVGEVMVDGSGNPRLAADHPDEGQGLHMAFNFAFASCPWRAEAFAEVVDEWESLLGVKTWPNYVLNNHDRSRSISRYAGGADTIPRAKVAAAMLLTLRGTPFLYYGEEIGMTDSRISRGRLQDPVGKRYWPLHPGRDPVRTPMQWDPAANAGFSTAELWLPVNKNYQKINASAQIQDPTSLLNWCRALIHLRNSEPALHSGDYRKIAAGGGIFCYERRYGMDRILVALNFSRKKKTLSLPTPGGWRPMLREDLSTSEAMSGPVTLPPLGVLLIKA